MKSSIHTMLLFISAMLIGTTLAGRKCAEFIGKIYCDDERRMANTIVQLWDSDESYEFLRQFNADDLAETHYFAYGDPPEFRIEGCAEDQNILWFQNKPEFYLKIRHNCKGYYEEEIFHPRDPQIFLPATNDHFDLHPIYLD